MKNLIALIFLLSPMAFAQSVYDYRSQFETVSPMDIPSRSYYQGPSAQDIPIPPTPSSLLPPLDARPTYPTTMSPVGTRANGTNISAPNIPNITCVPLGGGRMSCS